MSWWIEQIAPTSGNVCEATSWVNPEKSSRTVLSLNGTWQFRLHPSVEIDHDAPWETIELPNHWIFAIAKGGTAHRWERGLPIYTNVKFPFPHQPPKVPKDNPTGEHYRTFNIAASDLEQLGSNGRIILRLHGAESIAYIELNGEYIGTARGSRLMNDFDITGAVNAGENEIRVLVSQWSAMSYIEDQDQWWMPGIFRDIEILFEPDGGIRDLRVQTDWDPATKVGSANIYVSSSAGVANIKLAGKQFQIATGEWTRIDCGEVTPWNAETPYLHDLEVSTNVESRTERIGFRRVEITRVDGEPQIHVNGRKLVFRGVNRHETHPDKGRLFDEDQLRRDLKLMKRFNINAIRTSHYPPHPRFFELTDELGFWVIAEGDIETHGFEYVNWDENPSDDVRWREVYLDRTQRLVTRDYNRPSVIIWSLGNESGTGANLALAAQRIRSLDGSRLIHYESDHDCAYVDIYSRMYSPIEEIAAICSDSGKIHRGSITGQARARQKPFILCEYGHAMGNGPGGLELYDAMIEKYPRFHGGFIWEWRDHGLRTWAADGTEYYGYGGDFKEVIHDSNFVMDGLVRSDGEPSPGLIEFGAVNTPLRVKLSRTNTGIVATIENRFHTLNSNVTETRVKVGAAEPFVLPHDLEPGQSMQMQLPSSTDTQTVEAITCWALDTWWAKAGEEISRVQLREPSALVAAPWAEDQIGIIHNGKIEAPWNSLRPTFWRAPTDNDSLTTFGSYALAAPEDTGGIGDPNADSAAAAWRQSGLDKMVCLTQEVLNLRINGQPAIRHREIWAPPAADTYVVVEKTWILHRDGDIKLVVEITPSAGWYGTWPRTGICFKIPKPRSLTWEGMGPGEAYADSCAGVYLDTFTRRPEEMHFSYAVPQENGTRIGLRSLQLHYNEFDYLITTSANLTLPAYSDHYPSFSVSPWDEFELTEAKHPYQLPPPQESYCLFIDAGQHGLGSRSCGPDVRPEFAWSPRSVKLELQIRKIHREKG